LFNTPDRGLAYTYFLVMRPSYRPYYPSCLSVCPSVCLSRIWASNSKTKKLEIKQNWCERFLCQR